MSSTPATYAPDQPAAPEGGTAVVVPPPATGSAVVAIAAVQLTKLTPFPGGHTTSHTLTLHHRAGVSDEDQMRGIAVREAMELKPGFSVEQVLVTFASLPNNKVSESAESDVR